MGHLYSKSKNCKLKRVCDDSSILSNIKVLKTDVFIENKPTQIDEKSTIVLKYKTPHFR